MRVPLIVGLVLLGVGGFLLLGGRFSTQREVLEVGDLKVTAEEQHPIQPWIAGVAVVAGLGLIIVGARRKA